MYRHGDVIVKRVDVDTPNGIADVRAKLTLAYGEVTGHSHAVFGRVMPFTYNDKDYFEALDEVSLRHEEHGEIKLPPGVYEYIIQREYSPEGWKKVVD